MAINKVVNQSTKTHGAMRNVIGYVLRDDKVREGFVEITGPYPYDKIDKEGVYKAFVDEKKLWGKDSGRMYAHNIISFHAEENITPSVCLELGKRFVEEFFPGHQSLIGVHQDKQHLHCHIVTNTVSYKNGRKLHQSRKDLERQKEFTNRICREHDLSVAEKGRHFDGSAIETGEIRSWDKDKYNLVSASAKDSYLANCALAVMAVLPNVFSRLEFVQEMHERGWSVTWKDTRKHITFCDQNGHKVRDSNLKKTFCMDIGKETLEREFERQAERRAREQRELDEYYREIESVIEGADAAIEGTRTDGSSDRSTGSYCGGGREEIGTYVAELDADLEDARVAISGSKSQRRAVKDAENESVTREKQSRLRSRKRKAERNGRSMEPERTEGKREEDIGSDDIER